LTQATDTGISNMAKQRCYAERKRKRLIDEERVDYWFSPLMHKRSFIEEYDTVCRRYPSFAAAGDDRGRSIVDDNNHCG
jgi:hypothetical protein